MYHCTAPTCLLSAWCGSASSLVSEVVDFVGSAARFGASGEVAKGEALVLCQRGKAEVLGAEEEQRVEQHYRWVGAQLLTLPQVGLHNTGGNNATFRRKEEARAKKELSDLESGGRHTFCPTQWWDRFLAVTDCKNDRCIKRTGFDVNEYWITEPGLRQISFSSLPVCHYDNHLYITRRLLSHC